ncbi:IS3 family transposase [Sporolactobacillus sp. STSJ-5]
MISEIKAVKQKHPAYGYRRVVLTLRRCHLKVNHKRSSAS